MPQYILRDLPPDLHSALKESAERNRRSLNAEIIWRLENSVHENPIQAIRKVSVDEFRERARRFRESLGFESTDEEISRFKREGRL